MANSGNQKKKLLTLLKVLQADTDRDQGLSMPQIIERLAAEGLPAERKAVYRDIGALREAGFDVRMLPTRPVQYALVRDELGFDDVMMLVDIVQSSPFLSERKSNQLVRSLKDLVSDRERKSLGKRVHVEGRIRSQGDPVFHTIGQLHEAMRLKRKVEFLYFSYDTSLKRVARHDGRLYVVTPVKVVYARNYYYLVAYDEAGELMKTYRIDRMKIAQISAEKATRNAEIANYDADSAGVAGYQSFGMFHGDPVTVTLRVQAPIIDAIVDRFGRDVDVVKSAPDYADVRVSVQKSPQFFGWIAGLDGQVTIRTPKCLADEYRDWLKSLA